MAANFVRTVFDTAGNVTMIVIPDFDTQLNDPAFAPKGTIQADIPTATYKAATSQRDVLAAAQPLVAAKDAQVGLAVSAKIQAIDAAAALATAQAATDAQAVVE